MRIFQRFDPWIAAKSISLIFIFSKDIILYRNGMIRPLSHYVLIYSLLFFILMANDLLRFIYLLGKENYYCISLIISILLSCAIYYCLSSTGIYLYYLLLLYDVKVLTLNMTNFKQRINSFAHFIAYCLAVIALCINSVKESYENSQNLYFTLPSTSLFDLRFMLPENVAYQPWAYGTKFVFWHAMPPLLLYLLFNRLFYQVFLKSKFQKLNEDYKEANKKLENHARTVQELAIANERNRIAQDIHDSLGHSLTALIMNLDVMERVNAKDTSKIPEMIIKCQYYARNALTSVREAVYTLKEKDSSNAFMVSINEMIENLQDSEGVKVKFAFSDRVENLPPDITNALYRTIQESITNSIKHSNPELIGISLDFHSDLLYLEITDNGKGTENIVKGNGLKGIESRVSSLGGQVAFSSAVGEGFKTAVIMPVN